jgi:hypothetical protein
MAKPNRQNRIAVMAGLGLVIALVAGSASISRWSRRPTPPAPPTPSELELPAAEGAVLPQTRAGASFADVPPEPLAAIDPEATLPREEIERRRAMAARLRARIEAGHHEVPEGDYGGLLGDAEPVPIYRDGALAGIELRDVAPDGFYARLGLREGDLVRSLNGIPFDTPGLVGELIPSLLQSDRVEMDLERADGRADQISVPRDRVFEALEALEGADAGPWPPTGADESAD